MPNPINEPKTFTADELVLAALATSTRCEYGKDATYFMRAGFKLPATPESVLAWLVTSAPALKPATIQRRLIGIVHWHKERGLPSPVDAKVRKAYSGLLRTVGASQRAVKPLVRDDLLAVLASLQALHPTRIARDSALLLLLFSAALRRQSLVDLRIEDLEFHEYGVDLTLRRSKTDQAGRGLVVSVPSAIGDICPVRALRSWLQIAGARTGPVFRRVRRGGTVGDEPLDAGSVARIVKQAVRLSGRDPSNYSGHSGRAGFVTSAAQAQMPLGDIAGVTKHRGIQALQRYIRVVEQRRVKSLL